MEKSPKTVSESEEKSTDNNVDKKTIQKSKSKYKMLIIILTSLLILSLGTVAYLFFSGKITLTLNEETVNKDDEITETIENLEDFEKLLKEDISEGEEYVFFAYSEDSSENPSSIIFTVFNLSNKTEVISKEITMSLSNSETIDFHNVFFNQKNGDIYFSTSNPDISIQESPYNCSNDNWSFPTEACEMKIFKTNFLKGDIAKLHEQNGKFIWDYDVDNDRILTKVYNEENQKIEYKALDVNTGESKYLASAGEITEEITFVNSGNKLNFLENRIYEVLSVYNPDVLHQDSYIRLINLETGTWTEKKIPTISSSALVDYSLSDDKTKLAITFSKYDGGNNATPNIIIYDVETSVILSDTTDFSNDIDNYITPISDNGSLFYTSSDDYTYVFNISDKSSTKIMKGAPRVVSNNPDYLIVDSNEGDTMFVYNFNTNQNFDIKEYYPKLVNNLNGVADYSFLFGKM